MTKEELMIEPSGMDVKQIRFYSYSWDIREAYAFLAKWLESHPDISVVDIVIGSDEGTWVTLYVRP